MTKSAKKRLTKNCSDFLLLFDKGVEVRDVDVKAADDVASMTSLSTMSSSSSAVVKALANESRLVDEPLQDAEDLEYAVDFLEEEEAVDDDAIETSSSSIVNAFEEEEERRDVEEAEEEEEE